MNCPHCERRVSGILTTCPFCLEAIPSDALPTISRRSGAGSLKSVGRVETVVTWTVAALLLGGLLTAGTRLVSAAGPTSTSPIPARSEVSNRDYLERARAEYATRRYEEAGRDARTGLVLEQSAPGGSSLAPEFHALLADVYEAQEDYSAAAEELRWLADNVPGPYRERSRQLKERRRLSQEARAQADLAAAQAAWKSGDLTIAGDRARAVLQESSSRSLLASSQALLGQVYFRQNDRGRARHYLEAALENGSGDPTVRKLAAECARATPPQELIVTSMSEEPLPAAPLRPRLDSGPGYPRAVPKGTWERPMIPELRPPQAARPGPTAALPPPPGRAPAGPPPGRIVLPSLRVPDNLPRGGGLPSYQDQHRRDDSLPTYRSGNGGTLPGYQSSRP